MLSLTLPSFLLSFSLQQTQCACFMFCAYSEVFSCLVWSLSLWTDYRWSVFTALLSPAVSLSPSISLNPSIPFVSLFHASSVSLRPLSAGARGAGCGCGTPAPPWATPSEPSSCSRRAWQLRWRRSPPRFSRRGCGRRCWHELRGPELRRKNPAQDNQRNAGSNP